MEKQRQISYTSSSGWRVNRDKAQGGGTDSFKPCERPLLSPEGIKNSRHKVCHSISHEDFQKAFKSPDIPFPADSAVDTVNPWCTVDSSCLGTGHLLALLGMEPNALHTATPIPSRLLRYNIKILKKALCKGVELPITQRQSKQSEREKKGCKWLGLVHAKRKGCLLHK